VAPRRGTDREGPPRWPVRVLESTAVVCGELNPMSRLHSDIDADLLVGKRGRGHPSASMRNEDLRRGVVLLEDP